MPHVETIPDTIDAQFDRLLGPHTPEVQAIARAMRALVHDELPEKVEQVDFGSRLLALGLSDRMRDLMFAIIPHSGHVNLQLADGADLPDPSGIVEGTGRRIRHVKSRSLADVSRPAFHEIVRAQVARRRG